MSFNFSHLFKLCSRKCYISQWQIYWSVFPQGGFFFLGCRRLDKDYTWTCAKKIGPLVHDICVFPKNPTVWYLWWLILNLRHGPEEVAVWLAKRRRKCLIQESQSVWMLQNPQNKQHRRQTLWFHLSLEVASTNSWERSILEKLTFVTFTELGFLDKKLLSRFVMDLPVINPWVLFWIPVFFSDAFRTKNGIQREKFPSGRAPPPPVWEHPGQKKFKVYFAF